MIKSFVDTARDHLPGSLLDVVKHYNIVGGVGAVVGGAVTAGTVAGLTAVPFAAVVGSFALGSAVLGSAAAAGSVFLMNRQCKNLLQKNNTNTTVASVKKILQISPANIKNISQHMRNQEHLMRDLINTNPKAIQYASDQLRGQNPTSGDRKTALVIKAAEKDPTTLAFMHEDLKKDSEFMKEMCKKHNEAILHLHLDLSANNEFLKNLFLGDVTTAKKELEDLKTKINTLEKTTNTNDDASVQAELASARAKLKPAEEKIKAAKVATQKKLNEFFKLLKKNNSPILENPVIMTAIANEFPKEAFKVAGPAIQGDCEFMLPIILDNPSLLENADRKILDDLPTMRAVAKKHPEQAYNAILNREKSKEEEAAFKVGLRATSDKDAFKLADQIKTIELRNQFLEDPEFMLPVTCHNIGSLTSDVEDLSETTPGVLKHIGGVRINNLLSDPAFLAKLIEAYPENGEKNVVRDIVKEDMFSEVISSNQETLLALAKKYPKEVEKMFLNPGFETNPLLANAEFLRDLVIADVEILKILSTEQHLQSSFSLLSENEDLMLEIANIHAEEALTYAPYMLLKNKSFLTTIVTKKPELFRTATHKFREIDKEMKEFIKDCINLNPKVFEHVPNEKKFSDVVGHTHYQNLVLDLLGETEKSEFFQYVSPALRKDKSFVKDAIKKNPGVFKFADPELRKDQAYIETLFKLFPTETLDSKQRKEVFHCIDPSLKKNVAFIKGLKEMATTKNVHSKYISGVQQAILEDEACKGIVQTNRDFFTMNELKALIKDKPEKIALLKLNPIQDQDLIIELLSEVPEAISFIEDLQKSTRAKNIVTAISVRNLKILEELQKLEFDSPLRKNTYDILITQASFFTYVASEQAISYKEKFNQNKKVGFSGVSDENNILRFVSNRLLQKSPKVVINILDEYEKKGQTGIKQLELLGAAMGKPLALAPLAPVVTTTTTVAPTLTTTAAAVIDSERALLKKNWDLFMGLQKKFGKDVSQYADAAIRKARKGFNSGFEIIDTKPTS